MVFAFTDVWPLSHISQGGTSDQVVVPVLRSCCAPVMPLPHSTPLPQGTQPGVTTLPGHVVHPHIVTAIHSRMLHQSDLYHVHIHHTWATAWVCTHTQESRHAHAHILHRGAVFPFQRQVKPFCLYLSKGVGWELFILFPCYMSPLWIDLAVCNHLCDRIIEKSWTKG